MRNSIDGNMLIASRTSIQKFDIATNQFVQEWLPDSVNTSFNSVVEWRGKIYPGTSFKNLYEYAAGQWHRLAQGVLPSKEVGHLDVDKDDNLCLTDPGYIAKYDGSQFTVFSSTNTPAIIPNIYMRAIHCDSTRNIMLVATYSGILKYAIGTFTLLNDTNTVGIQQFYDAIETISEDDAHNIWFGTVYGGILKFDGTTFSTMLLPQHVGNQVVSGIEFAGDTLYVSDNLNGIWVYANSQWDSMNTLNSGLSDNFVSPLLRDRAGNLWISHLAYGMDIYNKIGVAVSRVEEVSALEAKVYPNPSTGRFLLESKVQATDIHIYNAEGQLVQQIIPTDSKTVIDLSCHARGFYFAKITTASGTQTLKLVVE